MTEHTSSPIESVVESASGPGGTATTKRTGIYPLPKPPKDDETEPQLTLPLALDVAAILQEHGFPPVAGRECVRLMRCLDEFIYGTEGEPES